MINRRCTISEEAESSHTYKVYSDITSLSECKLHNRATILETVDNLKNDALTLPASKLADHEKEVGWNHTQFNILHTHLRSEVDPSCHNTYDWAHNILQGIFQITVYQAVFALSPQIKPANLFDFVSGWEWPRRISGKSVTGVDMFNKDRSKSSWASQYWKCQASEALSMHPVLAHYFRSVVLPSGKHPEVSKAVITLSTLIHILWSGARYRIHYESVAKATTNFLIAFKAAFGDEPMVWKFHAVLHHSDYFRRYGWSPHTITLERKHKDVLKYGQDQTRGVGMVLREVVAESLSNFRYGKWLDLSIGLVEPKQPSKRLLALLNSEFGNVEHLISAKARYCEHEVAQVSDLIAFKGLGDWCVGEVEFFASSAGVSYACVVNCVCSRKEGWHSAWSKGSTRQFVDLEDILETLIYSVEGSCVTVLHPLSLVK